MTSRRAFLAAVAVAPVVVREVRSANWIMPPGSFRLHSFALIIEGTRVEHIVGVTDNQRQWDGPAPLGTITASYTRKRPRS